MISGSVRERRLVQVAVILATMALVTTACAGGSTSESSGQGPSKVAFKFTMGAPGASGAIVREAIAQLNERYGHKGQFVEVAESELAVEGVASGEFQVGSSTTSAVMQAMQQGAPLTFLSELLRNQWTLQAKQTFEGCRDLDGARLGLHTPGGVSTALYDAWVEQSCDSGVSPNRLYIAGSPNRFQALLADELDVAMIEIEDGIELPQQRFHTVANFSKELQEVKTGLIYANDAFLRQNPQAVVQLLAEIIRVQRKVNDDPSYFNQLLRKHVPEVGDQAEAIANAYTEGELFPANGGMTQQQVKATIDFFTQVGRLDPGMKPADIVDRSYLQRGLRSLDSQ